MSAESLITVEVSMPDDRYTLLDSGSRLAVHLAGPGKTGGTGPCICGFDRFARGDDGQMLHGFSVGGGVTGPGVTHDVCAECRALVGDSHIRGTHAHLFDEEATS